MPHVAVDNSSQPVPASTTADPVAAKPKRRVVLEMSKKAKFATKMLVPSGASGATGQSAQPIAAAVPDCVRAIARTQLVT